MGSFDLPEHFKHTLGTPLRAAREGCMELHTVEIEGKDVRDYVIKSELDLQQALIGIVRTIPDGIRSLFVEFLSGFSLRTSFSSLTWCNLS